MFNYLWKKLSSKTSIRWKIWSLHIVNMGTWNIASYARLSSLK